jgi:hypothetical protein
LARLELAPAIYLQRGPGSGRQGALSDALARLQAAIALDGGFVARPYACWPRPMLVATACGRRPSGPAARAVALAPRPIAATIATTTPSSAPTAVPTWPAGDRVGARLRSRHGLTHRGGPAPCEQNGRGSCWAGRSRSGSSYALGPGQTVGAAGRGHIVWGQQMGEPLNGSPHSHLPIWTALLVERLSRRRAAPRCGAPTSDDQEETRSRPTEEERRTHTAKSVRLPKHPARGSPRATTMPL